MSWSASEQMLNDAVQRMYREQGTVVDTGRPVSGVYYAPYQALRANDIRGFGVENQIPEPSLVIENDQLGDIVNGVQIDLRARRFTVIDSEPESYGTTRLLLQDYGPADPPGGQP
ncbi:MAG: hypothetical protein PF501_09910 [Salinisphaera sp.]|jgi:hypothetical protein|nr:hypothetical protein [Salinisphaera sp.]